VTTEWQYLILEPRDEDVEYLFYELNRQGHHGWELVATTERRLYMKREKQNPASSFTMTIKGEQVGNEFQIIITDGGADVAFQFTNSVGSPVAGPPDSVVPNLFVVPGAISSDDTIASVGITTPGVDPGAWVAAITPVTAGVVNINALPLVNSDNSEVLETEGPNAGQPFTLPDPIQLTVTEDDTPTGFSIAVTG
jgi:hypothetical protein